MIARGASALELVDQRINVDPVNYLIYNANRMGFADEFLQTGGSITTGLGV